LKESFKKIDLQVYQAVISLTVKERFVKKPTNINRKLCQCTCLAFGRKPPKDFSESDADQAVDYDLRLDEYGSEDQVEKEKFQYVEDDIKVDEELGKVLFTN